MNSLRPEYQPREGLASARLLMVLSSLSPLFVLLAVRGNCLIPEHWFISGCAAMATLPSLFLWLRWRTARRNRDTRQLVAHSVDDQRSYVLVYLFATLLPFYREEIASVRDLVAMGLALAFIVFLFWHLRLHYVNILFAVLRFQVFILLPGPNNDNPYTGREPLVYITRRRTIAPGERLVAYRLTDTVYVEAP